MLNRSFLKTLLNTCCAAGLAAFTLLMTACGGCEGCAEGCESCKDAAAVEATTDEAAETVEATAVEAASEETVTDETVIEGAVAEPTSAEEALAVEAAAITEEAPAAAHAVTLDLPKVEFVGTKIDYKGKVINLDPSIEQTPATPWKRDNPEISVPVEGVVLLSEGIEATSNDDGWAFDGTIVTDGDKGSEAATEMEYDPRYVQLDLGKEATLYGINLWHYHAQIRLYRDVVVQISNDPEFKEGVTTIFNNDLDNSAGQGAGEDFEYFETNEGKWFAIDGVKAQYVRAWSNGFVGGQQNHVIELEVYGVAE